MSARLLFMLALAPALACGGSRPSASGATPANASPRLVAVDVFDTDPAAIARVVERHGDALRAIAEDPADDRVATLVAEIRADGDYAYVEPSLVTYFEPKGSYLTIDLVDQRDAARRMPFTAEPGGAYPDPRGLIATWQAYTAKVHELWNHGESLRPPADCPSFQCLGDPRHPALRALADELTAGVPEHVDELVTILRDDQRAEHRAAAAYLLAYAPDGRMVVADLVPALHDPSMLVRNNAMRVLAEIALHHPEVDIPLDPILEALTYPSATDRNKAAATLYRLLARPGTSALYPRVVREAGATLLAMLRLAQPNNHDFAYKIFKTISGQGYGERDLAAWQAWLTRARS